TLRSRSRNRARSRASRRSPVRFYPERWAVSCDGVTADTGRTGPSCASVYRDPGHRSIIVYSGAPRRINGRPVVMIHGKRGIVVLAAYNGAKTLERTIAEIPSGVVDECLVVDDASRDDTVIHARRLGLACLVHPRNMGYGGNQKTCYTEALRRGADIVVM